MNYYGVLLYPLVLSPSLNLLSDLLYNIKSKKTLCYIAVSFYLLTSDVACVPVHISGFCCTSFLRLFLLMAFPHCANRGSSPTQEEKGIGYLGDQLFGTHRRKRRRKGGGGLRGEVLLMKTGREGRGVEHQRIILFLLHFILLQFSRNIRLFLLGDIFQGRKIQKGEKRLLLFALLFFPSKNAFEFCWRHLSWGPFLSRSLPFSTFTRRDNWYCQWYRCVFLVAYECIH